MRRLEGRSTRAGVVAMVILAVAALLPSGTAQAAETEGAGATRGVVARTATSVTTANGDGTETVKISPSPINYQDDAGIWRALDDSLVADAAGGYRRAAGPASIRFGANADAEVVKVSDDGWSVAMSMDGAARGRSASVQQGTSLVYPGVGQGLDLRYRVHGNTVKEELVLHAPPAQRESKRRASANTGSPSV